MNANKIQTTLALALIAGLAASAASAANESYGAEREQKQEQRQERQVAPHDYRREQRVANNQAQPPRQAQPNVAQPPRQAPPAGSPTAGGQRSGQRGTPPRTVASTPGGRSDWNRNGNGRGNYNGNGSDNNGGSYSGGNRRVVSPPHSPPGHQPGGGYSPGHARPPQIVPSLPYGYRRHYWNGNPYYYHGGHWYRPYGSSYIVVGAPYGLFVSSLPYYSSFWFGSTRYFYSDGAYYNYEPARHGYVVTQSPYASDSEDGDGYSDEELYVYPAQGQSEQQQADDRYECHRWAVDQTQYDPTDSDYDAQRRSEYTRAITACLTGRGYTVR